MGRLLLAGVLGLAVSLLLERWKRPAAAAVALHGGIYLLAFLVLAALCQRPFLGAGLALAAHALIAVASASKKRALREPMVFSDFGLFSQALRHPRLYLPYLRLLPAALAALACGLAIALGLWLEPPGMAWGAWGSLLALAVALLGAGAAAGRAALTLDPVRDVAAMGLLACAFLYWREERGALPEVPLPSPRVAPASLPDVVVVECESFFDARRIGAAIPRDLLPNFDLLRAEAMSGRLTVPAWGAYTMRTEFAFLSGIAPERLGVHRFNPYRRYARRALPTLASELRALGYRTMCVHPYPAAFFGRDRVFPLLGFDEFVDLAAFGAAPRCGPYVADEAVARKVGETLAGAQRPVFVFAITMENHGPHRLEARGAGEELGVYLRHLRNSDAMIGEIARALPSRRNGGVLCAFGDHVPSLPEAYAAAGFTDPRTDYLLWRGTGGEPARIDLRVEQLSAALLRVAGLTS